MKMGQAWLTLVLFLVAQLIQGQFGQTTTTTTVPQPTTPDTTRLDVNVSVTEVMVNLTWASVASGCTSNDYNVSYAIIHDAGNGVNCDQCVSSECAGNVHKANLVNLTSGALYNISILRNSITKWNDSVRTIPAAVTDLHVTSAGISGTLRVNFRAAPGVVDSYAVQVFEALTASSIANITLGKNVTSTNVGNLTSGRHYRVSVTTVSGHLSSNPAENISCVDPEHANNVILDNNGSTNNLTVTFTGVSGDVDQYVVELVDTTNRSVVRRELLSNTTTRHTFFNLVPGRLYQVNVTTLSGDCNSIQATNETCTAPEAAKNVTLENNGSTNNLTVSFIIANGDVTHYIVELVDMTNQFVVHATQQLNATTTRHVFSSLVPGRRYRVRVTTVSGDCNSVPATDEMCTVPETVQNVTLENNGRINNLTVSFAGVSGDVARYVVELVDTTNQAVVHTELLPNATTTYTFSGLVPGRRYRVSITTVSGDCNSTAATDEMCTVPETVQNVTLENIGSTNNLTVSFTVVSGDVSYYGVQLVDTTNQSVVKTKQLPNTTTTHTISGLVPGRRYQVIVTTVSGDCNSTVATDEMCTAPEAVRNITLENNGSTSNLTVSFNAANGDVTCYAVKLVDTTNLSVVQDNLCNTTTRYTFANLVAGRLYQAIVTTVSGDCNSTEETGSMRTVPEAVKNVTLENNGSTNNLTVNFNTANGDVTHYRVKLVDKTNLSIFWRVNLSNDTRVHTFNQLRACRVYQVSVLTVSGELSSELATKDACTDPTAVKDLALDNKETTDSLTVTFKQTSCDNASYAFELLEANSGSLVTAEAIRIDATTYKFKNLTPGRLYMVTVATIGGGCKGTRADKEMCTNPDVVTDLTLHNRGSSNSLAVSFMKAGGDVDNYIVELIDDTPLQITQSIFPNESEYTFVDLKPCTNYKVFVTTNSSWCKNTSNQTEELTYPNNVTNGNAGATNYNHLKISWDAPEGGVEFFNVSLSEGSWSQWLGNFSSSTRSHVTDALKYSTTYSVSVDACCQNLCSKVDFDGIIGLNLILIICLTLAAVALIVGAVTVFHFYGRRICSASAIPSGTILFSSTSMRKREPINFSKFAEHYRKLEADSGFLFSEEYQELSAVGKGQAMDAATLPENRTKNRYTNILPYDGSRVKLASIEDTPHSDYINANYIKGHSSSREYIAAQGPLAGTREDFWRMVWEQNVNQIVMLTNCVERGQPKCECYWPMDITPVRYGDISLTMTWDNPGPEWTIRHLLLKHKTGEERPLYHFHFTAWPDHGVPDTTNSLTSFVRIFRTHVNTTSKRGPIVVHCSAGVGRTGTFISLDHLLQDIDTKAEINIYGIVHDMRKSRVFMVQTEMQYIFIHKCALKLLVERSETDQGAVYSNEGIYENNIVNNFHMDRNHQNNNDNHTFLPDK